MTTCEELEIRAHSIDPWYLENLVCPIDHTQLRFDGHYLISKRGRHYPVVEGLPVLLVTDEAQTIGVAHASIKRAQGRSDGIDGRAPELYLESLGISEKEKAELVSIHKDGMTSIDPVAMMLIQATCGNAYKHLIGDRTLTEYPIPSVTLTPSETGNTLLDIGCNWGRWSVAAARKGFSVVGIDPSLGAVMAARRIAKVLNLDIKYLVADGRFLPFRECRFKVAYSYSVLQHLSKDDARKVISQISRVLEPGGLAKIQMANGWGLRSLQHQVRRRFREPKDFEVRYWTIAELKSMFSEIIGTTHISADCYFGLGWQWCDFRLILRKHKFVLIVSELLRRLSEIVWPIRMFADSVFCTAIKPRSV
jgi:2-polyprenyl-3-methyl-5-hydroxy-6-metoxy-1,4-benzoquinol methylase/uncharacterized protein YbaR (Trm112 family)